MFTTVFLLEFQSWYWRGRELGDPELRRAYDALKPPTTPEEFEQGFLALLRSDDTAARGIALDFYDRGEMTSRFVGANAFEEYEDEVFAVARQLLREPPWPGDEHTSRGANHASALLVLRRGGLDCDDAEDVNAVAAVVERMPEGELGENALMAARTLLEDQEEEGEAPDPRLIALVTRLEACEARVEEIADLGDDPGPEATAALVRATEDEEWRVRQQAAAALASGERFYAHRALLERLAESWGAEEESDARDEVHDALGDGPHSEYWEGREPETAELRAAHRELRSPTGESAHRGAFRTLLHSGRPVAVGIALDHFHHEDGLTRVGLDDAEHADDALAAARDVLGQPPSAADLSPAVGAGASHASALDIVQELGGPEDADVLAAALRAEGAPALVRDRAVRAASACLERWETPDEEVVAALEGPIFDGSLDMDIRTAAVDALFGLTSPRAAAVCLRAARAAELPIQVQGVIGLTSMSLVDEHRDLLREVVAAWPDDAGERALDIRAELL
ncbi:hypothetical protein [Streptomyces lasiicapitis]|uniref:hypothetical protein n=1 Tax=Streptomyces lasiicapitis TaxID=1923961 RepID=UPI0036B1E2F6